jgi:two-component system response regulator AtoC
VAIDDRTKTFSGTPDRAELPLWVVVLGPEGSARHPLPARGVVCIGRGEQSDVRINNERVSRRHLLLHLGPTVHAEDLGSHNGTTVNGERLVPAQPRALLAGDTVEVGPFTLIVQRASEAPVLSAQSASAIVLQDQAMRDVYVMIHQAAVGRINVLLLGETGVGKDVVAQEVHRASPRAGKPFVRLNCAAFQETLLESELFGHERGAFTGAVQTKTGLLESAEGGTVFLDEVGELPQPTQAKLLQVLETRQVLRVGSVKPHPIDVRFVAATNRNFEREIAAGRFRQDLYFRLAGFTVVIPPLRERRSEILALARHFLEAASQQMSKPVPTVTPEAAELLERHSWPGNIRELRNAMERAVLVCSTGAIAPQHIQLEKPGTVATSVVSDDDAPPPGLTATQRDERQRIIEVLSACAGNQTQAARRLGMARSTLVIRLDLYKVPRPRKADGVDEP